MLRRQIGKSDLYASEVGLGCMSLKPATNESKYIIDKAIDEGVNYFDTADLYDFGENEQLLGEALKGKRQEVILATKVGNQWNESKESWSWNPRKKYIKTAVKKSLKRLQTDYIDLYQLHGGTIEDDSDETIEAFEELVKEGFIRYYGISSIRPNVIKQFLKHSNIVSVMMQYNLLDRRLEEEVLKLLLENKISIIARGPVAKGLLTERFSGKINGSYLNYSEKELKEMLPSLKDWANQHHYRLEELAIQYCLATPTVAAVVPGASSVSQLQSNLSAIKKPKLNDPQLNSLQKLLKKDIYTSHRD